MRATSITTGALYLIKLGRRLAAVRVDRIVRQFEMSRRPVLTYFCTDVATGREIKVLSARKFRSRVFS